MERREFVAGGIVLLALPRLAASQAKVPTIGLLWNDSVKPSPYVAILSEALREKGYVLGRNVRFDDAVALEGYAPMAENAARLVRANVNLIVTFGATATVAAAKVTKEVPILMIIGADPVATGLAKSLARPGGNVTGVWTLSSGLHGKRIELMKQLVPGLSRLGILLAPESAAAKAGMVEAEGAAQTLKGSVVKAEVRAADDIEPAVGRLAQSRVGGIVVLPSTMLLAQGARVVASMAKHAMPAVYGNERYGEIGGLLVYASSARKAFGPIANHIDRILKGGRPGEIPIEQTSDVELVINLKAARALGISIPQSILQRADRAIE